MNCAPLLGYHVNYNFLVWIWENFWFKWSEVTEPWSTVSQRCDKALWKLLWISTAIISRTSLTHLLLIIIINNVRIIFDVTNRTLVDLSLMTDKIIDVFICFTMQYCSKQPVAILDLKIWGRRKMEEIFLERAIKIWIFHRQPTKCIQN